jgi:membrane protein implicated in regulation of membrane protease activity
MESIILQNLPWVWIIVGGILMSLELILPGMFIFFVGFSLVVTGLLSFCIPMTITIQMVVFSIISIISVLIGSAFLKKFFPSDVSRGGLIKDDFKNQIVFVTQDILVNQKSGRVSFHGTDWDAYCLTQRIPKGEKVRILDRDNLTFIVEPLEI